MYNWTVSQVKNKIRLSDIDLSVIPFIHSKSAWKKYIKDGLVKVNNQLASTATWIENNDKITIQGRRAPEGKPYCLDLEIVYEDNLLVVINKPSGLWVSGNKHRTLNNALLYHYESDVSIGSWCPRCVHRLDAATSGLVIAAKSYHSMQSLLNLFSEKKVTKQYIAITSGEVPVSGMINLDIQGKEAVSEFNLLKSVKSRKYGNLSLVEISIYTGRTHQIRIHMNAIGHPIIGDKIYNFGKSREVKGLFLHAWRLNFEHPDLRRLNVVSAIPMRFKKFGISPEDLPHY